MSYKISIVNSRVFRLSHLWLAITSAIFLIIASITGAILSFEPVYEHSYGHSLPSAQKLSIAELVKAVSNQYIEVLSISRDHNGFVLISVFDNEGESTFYINPITGDRIGDLIQTPEIFNLCRTLHRSLFFGRIGRFLVGIASVFLFIISITGFLLVVKKQGGLTSYFQKIIKEDFYRDYHTLFGRVFVLAILAISITGTILFLDRFHILPQQNVEHKIDYDNLPINDPVDLTSFAIFTSHQLSELKELIFPFTDFEDDFFELKLTDQELLINQKTGATVSKIAYSNSRLLSNFAFKWHTAEGQPWWAVLLGISSLSILFFLYSGLKIYLKRPSSKSKWQNPYSKETCDWVIAVGSETGNTMIMAKVFHQALLTIGMKAWITEMNTLEHFNSMKYLIVMTSTYGKGNPPANASQFIKKFNGTNESLNPFKYCVIGFGSSSYPDFCQYAIEVNHLLTENPLATELIPLHKIDNQSSDAFQQWVSDFTDKTKLQLKVETKSLLKKTTELTVVKKAFSDNSDDATFLLRLRTTKRKLKGYESGDLLGFRPEGEVARYYSMSVSKDKKSVLLSIKRHELGLASSYLSQLVPGDRFEVFFESNPGFHFTHKAKQILMIANGTGVAPFLGMLENNTRKIPTTLFWGGQNEASFKLYLPYIKSVRAEDKLNRLETAFSRVGEQSRYVQELVTGNKEIVVDLLRQEGVIMICGSLQMQEEVEKIIHDISVAHLKKPLSYFKECDLIKADCY